MQLGLSTAAFYGKWETDESAQAISGLPLDCAEVFLQCASEYTTDFALEVRRRLGRVRCTSVHPLGTQFENGMMSLSSRQRRDTMDLFCRVLDAGSALGAAAYVYHGRNTPQLAPLAWNLQSNVDVLGPMCEAAQERGMVIAWENVFWCQLTTPQRVQQARRALPQVRFTLDIKQSMRAGYDPLDFVQAMGSQLCNVHVCDWQPAGTLCLPGEGCFNFAQLMAALRKIGYDGPVILEPYFSMIRDMEALTDALAYLRRLLACTEQTALRGFTT